MISHIKSKLNGSDPGAKITRRQVGSFVHSCKFYLKKLAVCGDWSESLWVPISPPTSPLFSSRLPVYTTTASSLLSKNYKYSLIKPAHDFSSFFLILFCLKLNLKSNNKTAWLEKQVGLRPRASRRRRRLVRRWYRSSIGCRTYWRRSAASCRRYRCRRWQLLAARAAASPAC